MPDEPPTSDQPGTPDQPEPAPGPAAQPNLSKDQGEPTQVIAAEPAEPAGFTQESSGYGYVPQDTPPAQPSPGYDGYQENWPQQAATGWNPEAPGYPDYPEQPGYGPNPGYPGYPQPGYPQPGYPPEVYPQQQPDYGPQGYVQPGYGPEGQPPQGYGQPWDQQQPPPGYGYPVPGPPQPGQPQPGSQKTTWIVAGVVLAVLVLGGGVFYVLSHRTTKDCSVASASTTGGCITPTSTTEPAQPATTQPETTQPEPDPVQTTEPADDTITTPDAAMAASKTAAKDELQAESDQNASVASNLQGKWVPQVSSKCVGVSADVGPNWIPDGTADTSSISINQILAFNLSLKERFGAITVRQTQVGISQDTGKAGICKGQILWMSIVPQGFSSANAANEWCDSNVPVLLDECLARYDARPGETSTPKYRTK